MLATPRGQSLWILCASTRDLWILGWFCGFIWLRAGVFGTLSSLQIGTFLVELWVVRKAPWTSLDSSRIILDHFCDFRKFHIFHHFLRHFHHVCDRAGLPSRPSDEWITFSWTSCLYLKGLIQVLTGVITVLRTRSPKLTIHPFARDLKNHPSGPPWTMLEESASHHIS